MGHHAVGALRVDLLRAASAPYPASALVAGAEVPDGWIFAAEDGTVYRAPHFLGPLRVIGAVPARAQALSAAPGELRGVQSHGQAVFYADTGDTWVVDELGEARKLSLAHVLSGAFLDPRTGLFLVEGGALMVTHDGGAHFEPVALDGVVPTAVAWVHEALVVYSTEATYRWVDGRLLRADDMPGLEVWRDADREVRPVLGRREAGLTLPTSPDAAARFDRSRYAVIEDDHLSVRDLNTGLEDIHEGLPGSACRLYESATGLKAVCTVASTERVLFTRETGGRWRPLRDERNHEPIGELVFDLQTPLWAASGPCETRDPAPDPRALCVVSRDARGQTVQVTRQLPFDARPVSASHGAVLVTEYAAGADGVRAALVRGDAVTTFVLPTRGAMALTARLSAQHVVVDAPLADGAVGLMVGALDADGSVRFAAQPALTGARLVAVGAEASVAVNATGVPRFFHLRTGRSTLSSPVAGSPTVLGFDPSSTGYCVGPRCRLGEAEFVFGAAGQPPLVARASAIAAPTLAREVTLDCAPGRASATASGAPSMRVAEAARDRWQNGEVTVEFGGQPPVTQRLAVPPRLPGASLDRRRALDPRVSALALLRRDERGFDAVLASPGFIRHIAGLEGATEATLLPFAPGHLGLLFSQRREGVYYTSLLRFDSALGAPLGRRKAVYGARFGLPGAGVYGARDVLMHLDAIDAAHLATPEGETVLQLRLDPQRPCGEAQAEGEVFRQRAAITVLLGDARLASGHDGGADSAVEVWQVRGAEACLAGFVLGPETARWTLRRVGSSFEGVAVVNGQPQPVQCQLSR